MPAQRHADVAAAALAAKVSRPILASGSRRLQEPIYRTRCSIRTSGEYGADAAMPCPLIGPCPGDSRIAADAFALLPGKIACSHPGYREKARFRPHICEI